MATFKTNSPWDDIPVKTTIHGESLVTHSGQFDPLRTYNGPIYCTRMIFRNMRDVEVTIVYKSSIIYGILGKTYCDEKLASQASVSYRNTVPCVYESAPSLAGPYGIHEFLIDGASFVPPVSKHTGKTKVSRLSFICNLQSPISFDIINCSGKWIVDGIQREHVESRFTADPPVEIIYRYTDLLPV